MERLTLRNKEGQAIAKAVNYLSMLDKLADYEDAEEQGLLLRLPCKVGGTVYTIYQHKIIIGKLRRISIRKEGATFFAKFDGLPIESLLYEDYFGKTIFLSTEEAEKALADMGV